MVTATHQPSSSIVAIEVDSRMIASGCAHLKSMLMGKLPQSKALPEDRSLICEGLRLANQVNEKGLRGFIGQIS